MDEQTRMERLIAELEDMVLEEPVALQEENWEYLKELLAKKEGHLKAIEKLAKNVDWEHGKLKSRLAKIKEAEDALAGKLAEKMKETKANISLVADGLKKIKKVKTYSATNVPFPIAKRKGSFDAQA